MKKDKTIALLLCIFLGYLGIHRFYLGKTKTGILYLFTVGLCGIGWIADIINIANDVFTDGSGNYLSMPVTENQILNENKKIPIQRKWQFWVGVVIIFAILMAIPSKSKETATDTNIISSDTLTSSLTNSVLYMDTVDEPKKINLCDTDTDFKEYSIIVDNTFSTNAYYHCDENCTQLKYLDEDDKDYYVIKTPSIIAMEEYLDSLNLKDCYECVNWSDEKEAEIKAESARERELKTKEINLCSDTDGEIHSIILDTNSGVYHIKENCNKMMLTVEKDKLYYKITANSINDIDQYFISNDYKHCTNCVELEKDTESNIESKFESTSESVSVAPQLQTYTFKVNIETGTFHSKSCGPSQSLLPENTKIMDVEAYTKQEAIDYMISCNYQYCGQCAR